MTPGKANLNIYKGSDFRKILRWETGPLVYKSISAIPSLAPLRLTVTGHQMLNGWRFAIQSVKGMTQLNASKNPPVEKDFYTGTVIDADTIEVNNLNASDFSNYTSGGVIVYNTPTNLTGYTARLTIKDKVGGTELLSLTTENDRINLSTANATIMLELDATTTSAITFSKGVYDLELMDSTGAVSKLLSGSIKVFEEVTT